MASIPQNFKQYLSALRRADELAKETDRESLIVSYFCRLYVAIKSYPLMNKDNKEEQEFVVKQFDILEKLKPSLNLTSEADSKEICLNYAIKIFDKANEIFNNNLADKSTAKLYYSAGTFFDILDQFGELTPEIQEMKKYAKWRATEIINACNNGEQPLATGEIFPSKSSESYSNDLSTVTSSLNSSSTTTSTPSAPAFSAPPIPQASSAPPSSFTPPVNIANIPPTTLYPHGSVPPVPARPPTQPSDPRIKDAIELLNFSIASLKYNDLSGAKDKIFEALNRIG